MLNTLRLEWMRVFVFVDLLDFRSGSVLLRATSWMRSQRNPPRMVFRCRCSDALCFGEPLQSHSPVLVRL